MTARPAPGEPDAARLQELADGLAIVAARALGAGDDARDAVQEALSRLIVALRGGAVPPGVSHAAFVHGILKHVIADQYRRRARRVVNVGDVDAIVASGPSPLEQLVSEEERELMARAIADLAPDDRALLHACYVDGERLVDIAARLHEPQERIRKRKSRLLAKVRAALELMTGHDSQARPT